MFASGRHAASGQRQQQQRQRQRQQQQQQQQQRQQLQPLPTILLCTICKSLEVKCLGDIKPSSRIFCLMLENLNKNG
jgi:hypothetical protein